MTSVSLPPQPIASPPCLLHSLTLRGMLSFGPTTAPLELRRLNVLIGANGSGKSNLLEALALLRATPHRAAPNDIRAVIGRGGGIHEWIWKGNPHGTALLEAIVQPPQHATPVRHTLAFREEHQRFRLDDESITDAQPLAGHVSPVDYYRYQQGHPHIALRGTLHPIPRTQVEPDVSILAQRRDPDTYPILTDLANAYDHIRLYREWSFGRTAVTREPQRTDLRIDRLEEDGSNLGLVLNRLRRHPQAKATILDRLQDLYAGISDFDVSVVSGTVQVFVTEGEYTIPATRLSDGTLRYVCLLAILCDPDPPPLIGIEEPELGLHPDILPKIADLLVSAAERTQLIVTTHSDVLVDALTDHPEAILVCEKHAGQTVIERLDREQLAPWLEHYRLGDLWTRGELGGTRW